MNPVMAQLKYEIQVNTRIRVTRATTDRNFISQFLYYTYNLAWASLATVDLIKPLGSEDG